MLHPGIGEHLRFEDIRELIEDEAVSTEWAERMLHLRFCEDCRQEMRERFPAQAPRLLERLFPRLRAATPDVDGPANTSWKRWENLPEADLRAALACQRALAHEEEEAVELWRRFRDHDEAQWSLLISNHPRIQTFGMVRLLLRRAKASWRSNPRRAETLTRAALGILDHLPRDRYHRLQVEQTHTLAWGYLANALRGQGRLEQADSALSRAEALLPGEFSLLEEAWLWRFKTSLRRAQRRFEDARRFARKSKCRFRKLRDPEAPWLVLLEAFVVRECGELEESETLIRHLLEQTPVPSFPPEVHFLAIQHLTVTLALQGRGLEARRRLRELERRADEFPEPLSQARLAWTRGLVFDALAQWPRAAECYRTARRVFVDWRNAYDVALVSLDLAAVELEQGHTAEAAKLASEILPIFRSLKIERETLAALRLLAGALHQGEVTVSAVREAAWRLRAPGYSAEKQTPPGS